MLSLLFSMSLLSFLLSVICFLHSLSFYLSHSILSLFLDLPFFLLLSLSLRSLSPSLFSAFSFFPFSFSFFPLFISFLLFPLSLTTALVFRWLVKSRTLMAVQINGSRTVKVQQGGTMHKEMKSVLIPENDGCGSESSADASRRFGQFKGG